jgi:uncharacterized SAM-binding protein YcdF (DUF218 family)
MAPGALGCGLALALLTLLSGCAAWHDLFQRDQPDPAALAEARSLPAPATTDVAVVLGCPSEDDGRPSPCLQCRVRAAQQVLSQGRVRALIFSGGAAHNRHVEAEVMASLAQRRGVGREQVLLEGRSLTTWQNLRFSQRIMRAQGFQSALLISTRDHLPRARRFAAYYGIPVALFACEDAGLGEPGPSSEHASR